MKELVTLSLLPAGKRLQVPRNTPLKDVLFEHGVEFPCGGHGRCKGCKIRVLEGELPIFPGERAKFSQTELDQGWRLSCMARATRDLTLELAQWEAAILGDETEFKFHPEQGYGVAVDLGTTTIVAQLVDLASGSVVSVCSRLNAQARYGADIMSRVEFAMSENGRGQKVLEKIVRDQICEMLVELASSAQGSAFAQPDETIVAEPKLLSKVIIVGNTVMHHLFCGLSVEPLSQYPFVPHESGMRTFSIEELGWSLKGGTVVSFLPCLGGFVGSDVLAGLLATGLHTAEGISVLLDLGTNGEIVVGNRDRLLCASTAAGPAFEGARVSMGMRAATGAISAVAVEQGRLKCHVLGNVSPRGICGSGLVDAVAAGLQLGMVRRNGRLSQGETLLLDTPVSLSQWDVRELQMAKGAIAAGLRILLQELGAQLDDVQTLYLAGAFGNYISLESGRAIGLLQVPDNRIKPSGNTALLGAKLALFQRGELYADLLGKTRHVSLHEVPGFQDIYAEEMLFP